jgi:hypothetical protein
MFSLDAGYTWMPGGLLAATDHPEASPALSVASDGSFHLLYTDVTQCQAQHRLSFTPEDLGSWSVPVVVSDSSVCAEPEATHLEALTASEKTVGAVYVTCGARLGLFDSNRHCAAAIDQDEPVAAASSSASSQVAIKLAGPSPVTLPVELLIESAAFPAGAALRIAARGRDRWWNPQVEIHDPAGRRIRRLDLGTQALGSLQGEARRVQVFWDGTDQRRRPVPSGLYVASLRTMGPGTTGNRCGSVRFLLVR